MLPKHFIKPIHKLTTEACYICERKNYSLESAGIKELHHEYSSDHFSTLFQAVNSIRHSEHVGDYIFVRFEKVVFANQLNNEYIAIEVLM
jgi:hypothetical protein